MTPSYFLAMGFMVGLLLGAGMAVWFALRGPRPVASDARATDEPDHAVAHVECPDCGAVIPIGMAPIRLETDDDGQQVAIADLLMDDVWAHAWTHDPEADHV
jgi:hypothetical protein